MYTLHTIHCVGAVQEHGKAAAGCWPGADETQQLRVARAAEEGCSDEQLALATQARALPACNRMHVCSIMCMGAFRMHSVVVHAPLMH